MCDRGSKEIYAVGTITLDKGNGFFIVNLYKNMLKKEGVKEMMKKLICFGHVMTSCRQKKILSLMIIPMRQDNRSL